MRCPTCKHPIAERTSWAPFCCERCKLVDLQKWLGGVYVIPGRPLEPHEAAAVGEVSGHGDDDEH